MYLIWLILVIKKCIYNLYNEAPVPSMPMARDFINDTFWRKSLHLKIFVCKFADEFQKSVACSDSSYVINSCR